MHKMKSVVLLSISVWSGIAIAQWTDWAAGIGAAGKAMAPFMQQWAEEERQKELIRQQHDLEMKRIEREHELRMRSIREQEDSRRRAAEQQASTAVQRELQRIESAHPGWESTVRSPEFAAWRKQQPESVNQLAASESARDAILMIDLFKRDQRTHSPVGHLSRAAGIYIGANEYLRVLATTECGYALKRKAAPTAEFLVGEVLPGFPPDARQEVRDAFSKMLPDLHSQGEKHVVSMIASASKEQRGDKKTACGYVVGTLVGTLLRAGDNWIAVRNKYGDRN